MISNSNGWRAWRMPRSLHTTYFLCRCQEKAGNFWPLQNTKLFVPTQIFILFSGTQKSLTRLTPTFPDFFGIVFVYYWTCFRPVYNCNTARWKLSNNQSIHSCINFFFVVDSNTKRLYWVDAYLFHVKTIRYNGEDAITVVGRDDGVFPLSLSDVAVHNTAVYFIQYGTIYKFDRNTTEGLTEVGRYLRDAKGLQIFADGVQLKGSMNFTRK